MENVCFYWTRGKKFGQAVLSLDCDTRILNEFVSMHRRSITSDNIQIQPSYEILKDAWGARDFLAINYAYNVSSLVHTTLVTFNFISRHFNALVENGAMKPDIEENHYKYLTEKVDRTSRIDFEGIERTIYWIDRYYEYQTDIFDDPEKFARFENAPYVDTDLWVIRGYPGQAETRTSKKSGCIDYESPGLETIARLLLRSNFPQEGCNDDTWRVVRDIYLMETKPTFKKATLRTQRDLRKAEFQTPSGLLIKDAVGRIAFQPNGSKKTFYLLETLEFDSRDKFWKKARKIAAKQEL